MVRRVLGGSGEIQGYFKGILEAGYSTPQCNGVCNMDWVCWMWSLVIKMDFKNITPYGLVEYSHLETCAKP